MLNIRIQNVGDKSIGSATGIPLPPPFHMIRLGPGEEDKSVCQAEDLHKQYPHRSGFRVADILQQLVQLGRIHVDIKRVGEESRQVNLAEFIGYESEPVKEKPFPSAPLPREARSEPEPLPEPPAVALEKDDEYEPSLVFPEAPSVPSGPNAVQMPQFDEPDVGDAGDDMSGEDDLPEMVDPLFHTPPKDQAKKSKPAQVPPPTPELPVASSPAATTGMAVDLPDDAFVTPPPKREDPHKDKFEGAMKMTFIGAGQGGGRLAESFHRLGYKRVCVVNTTQQDLSSLEVPHKLVIGKNRGGAGKDPEQGRLAAKESYEDIMDLMMRSWGDGVEQIFVCIGGGGGSGTGSWPVLVKAAKEYAESTNIEKPIAKHLGVIMTMPKRSEGSRVQYNALQALRQAVDMVEAKKISTLIIVDNAKIHDLYPGLPVKKFWRTTNHNFTAMLHTFNLLAAKDSEYNTFDREDFRSVIRNGIVIFGMTVVHEYTQKEDISLAVRQNLTGSLLADGFDLSKADMAGAIVVAHDSVLEEVPMENIDYALFSLGRTLGNEGITLHSGLYEGSSPGMRVFTIVSGLEPPNERLDELERLSGA